ncbi:hypothetical protein ART_0899 [Arthrobacter sp. PAMC 25486]|nr:hypothetical protein ART_0899 [Arthrobacter sp. PAMC 25486]
MERLRMVDRFAILGLSLSLALAGCTSDGTGEGDATMPASSTTSSSALVTDAPLETATASQTLPVYWLGRSNDDVFLYREFFPSKSTDDPMVAALRTMMSSKPNDPDYFSLWNSPSRLGASISAKNVITVDVSADAFGQKVDEGIAKRSIAQLVYTATAAAAMAGLVDTSSSIQVSVLVDGHTGYDAFGHVSLDKPLTRDASLVAPVWIIDPSNDATYKTLPLKVEGQGISPTGNLSWSLAKVSNDTVGEEYLNGTVAIPEGPNELGNFSFSLIPPPGAYQLSVFLDDPQAPGKRLGVDTKMVRIAGQNVK